MRTKTLLVACAALAFSLAPSQAQVYSQNIVGYVTYVSSTVSPKYELICNPLNNGTNTIASLFATPPAGTTLDLWQPSGGFTSYAYAPKAGGWGANGSIVIPPGQGFFIQVGGSGTYTNTFVGTVTPLHGVTGTNVINPGFQALSSMVPYADSVNNTATINLVVPSGTALDKWDIVSQGFVSYTYAPKAGGWSPSVPSVNVGQGVFIQNNGATPINWVQTGP